MIYYYRTDSYSYNQCPCTLSCISVVSYIVTETSKRMYPPSQIILFLDVTVDLRSNRTTVRQMYSSLVLLFSSRTSRMSTPQASTPKWSCSIHDGLLLPYFVVVCRLFEFSSLRAFTRTYGLHRTDNRPSLDILESWLASRTWTTSRLVRNYIR